MELTFHVRRAVAADAAAIAEYNVRLAWETEQKRLDLATVRTGVEAVLNDLSKGVYYVADCGGDVVVGQVCVTYEWSDWRNGNFWWLQSVYVEMGWRGRGLFRNLFTHVKREAARAGNVVGLRLYVEEHNAAAQEVYRRRGMQRAAYQVFELEIEPRAGLEVIKPG
ncbi:MAG: GNAT family N-acetyltransferase [Limisphaerales bacterium]